jgi:PAS domain S-box-containing protein
LSGKVEDPHRRIADLEAAEQEARRQIELLTAVGDLAVKLTAASADADLYELIAEHLKSATRSLGAAISTYDAETGELCLQCLAVEPQVLSRINQVAGRDLVGARVPLTPELHRKVVAQVVRPSLDPSEVTFGLVARPVAARLGDELEIGNLVGLSLQHGGELVGTAAIVMPPGQPPLPLDVLEFYAHVAAVSLQRKRAKARALRATQALKQSEERYRTLIETSPDGIMVLDLQANIVMANRRLAELYGCESPEELIGQSAFQYIAPEEYERATAALQAFLTARVMRAEEYRLLRQDGSSYPAEVSAALLLDADDVPQAILNVVRDISERKRMEAAMQQRNRELELLNQAGQALNASLRPDQVLSTALQRVCEVLDVVACSIWLVEPGTSDLVCRCASGPAADTLKGWRLALGEGLAGWVAQSGMSLVVPDTHAEERHYKDVEHQTGLALRSVISVPLRLRDRVIGALQVLDTEVDRFKATDLILVESLAASAAIALENARLYEDLQERMAELERTQAQLVESAKLAAIGRLAAGVAHEINTPLTSVLGFSELLLERLPPDDANRQQLSTIARQARRAQAIVGDLLDFSRQAELHQEEVDLNQVIQETLGMVRGPLEADGITVEEQYAPDLPPLMLAPGRMAQVILNLVTNAQYAMPDGGTLAISSKRNGDQVAVCIADTGEGIRPENLSRIFEPFFTTKPVGEGTGLGLPVSLGIVQEHGGRMEVDSEVGQGSSFTVQLPLDGRQRKGA